MFQISNDDLGRISNRKSERYLSAMNMLLMTLPGLAFMYYGDEIGMRHISVSYEQTQDPFGVLSGPVSARLVSYTDDLRNSLRLH